MARVSIIGAYPPSLVNFRGDLIRELIGQGHEITAMSAPADPETISRIEELGATFRPFSVRRRALNPWADLQTLLALWVSFRKEQPDIVLAYTIKPVIWSGLALKWNRRIRFFALITGLGAAFGGFGSPRRSLAALMTVLYRLALRKASGVFFQNPNDLNFFVARKIIEPSKSHLVEGSGINLERFPASPLPSSSPVFLTIARLLVQKGLREYARAAEIIKRKHPEVVFRLLGPPDPSGGSLPLDEVASWQREGWLEYLGETPDVRPVLKDCHIYVLASFYNEGLPRTVLEAMAVGRPILTTDTPGCRETVRPGENGFLVPPADPKALAERMVWFIEHRDQWDYMGRKSRELAEDRFDVRKVNSKMIEVMGLASAGS